MHFDFSKMNKYGHRLTTKTECGHEWTEPLPSGCIACNGGPHYHYSNGSCDTEPCVKHGGPQ